jgi:single-strand DNA-binding protein
MNNVNLIGHLVRDPEIMYTQSGVAVCNNSIAVDEGYGDKKQTYFFNLKWFAKVAETVATLTFKGQKIGITGNLIQRSYEKDGRKQYVIEIRVKEFKLLSFKDKADEGYQPNDLPPLSDSDLPF